MGGERGRGVAEGIIRENTTNCGRVCNAREKKKEVHKRGVGFGVGGVLVKRRKRRKRRKWVGARRVLFKSSLKGGEITKKGSARFQPWKVP